MGRKNSAVRKKNNSTRRLKARDAPPPRPIEVVVLPQGRCPGTGKPRFASKSDAAKALRFAQQDRARAGSGHVEKRWYECDINGCDGFHLTSREEWTR